MPVCDRHSGENRNPEPKKHWIPAGVYPDENRGRNDKLIGLNYKNTFNALN